MRTVRRAGRDPGGGGVAMGEIADMMADGTLCSECSGPVDEPLGCPTVCLECKLEHELRATDKDSRRRKADAEFSDAARLAHGCDLTLKRHTEQHYSLRGAVCGDSFQLNIYPGNQRLYSQDRKLGYVNMAAGPWGLFDVVNSVIDHIAKRERAKETGR